MIKLIKEHPYLVMIHIALVFVSVGIGFDSGIPDALVTFGVGSAAATAFSWATHTEW